MKTWYCVVTTVTDRYTTANIVDQTTADEPPASDFRSTSRTDIYIDWFDKTEVKRYIKEAAAL